MRTLIPSPNNSISSSVLIARKWIESKVDRLWNGDCKMEKYNVICYRLNRNTNPIVVLEVLEALLKKHSVFYTECLFRINVSICEYEYDGKLHSNRNKNAVNTLLKRYPELEDYYKYIREEKSRFDISEHVCIGNFSYDNFSCTGEIEYILVRDIVQSVPRPYSVNNLDLIYNGISFGIKDINSAKIRQSENGWDSPVGNYIWYDRSSYGSEKHSYIRFAISEENLDSMRKLFFELAEKLPGKYEGTEYHS